jgi:hypothetical protein
MTDKATLKTGGASKTYWNNPLFKEFRRCPDCDCEEVKASGVGWWGFGWFHEVELLCPKCEGKGEILMKGTLGSILGVSLFYWFFISFILFRGPAPGIGWLIFWYGLGLFMPVFYSLSYLAYPAVKPIPEDQSFAKEMIKNFEQIETQSHHFIGKILLKVEAGNFFLGALAPIIFIILILGLALGIGYFQGV